MAQIAKRLPQNAEGDFFVDSTCIDCDACRQIAPAVLCELHDQSIVYHQPRSPEQTRRALMAFPEK